MFLRNVRSYKSHMTSKPSRRHSSFTLFLISVISESECSATVSLEFLCPVGRRTQHTASFWSSQIASICNCNPRIATRISRYYVQWSHKKQWAIPPIPKCVGNCRNTGSGVLLVAAAAVRNGYQSLFESRSFRDMKCPTRKINVRALLTSFCTISHRTKLNTFCYYLKRLDTLRNQMEGTSPGEHIKVSLPFLLCIYFLTAVR
jgi:hypothetical protein